MHDAEQINPEFASARLLPAWWRHVLIAVGILILSSCQGLPLPTTESAILATALSAAAAGATEAVVGQDDPQATSGATSNRNTATADGWVTDNLQVAPAQSAPEQAGPSSQYYVPQEVAPPTAAGPPTGAACPPTGMANPQPCVACTPLGPGDEYLCDGGDFGAPAGVRADWSIEGLEQEDAVAHYDTVDGRVLVVPSNRVCIYAPRFASVRQVINPLVAEQPIYVDIVVEDQKLARAAIRQPPASSVQRHAVKTDLASMPPILFRQRQQPGGLENLEATMEVYNSLALYCNVDIIRLGQVNGTQTAKVKRSVQHAITWTGDQAPQVVIDNRIVQAQVGLGIPEIIYQTNGPESPRLRLLKMASTGNALPGEEVEFTLRFDNIGDQVIGNVTIVDNLATRLEYVPNSAKSTIDAKFLTQENSGGSTILRWEISSPVQPGQGGILQFKARVR